MNYKIGDRIRLLKNNPHYSYYYKGLDRDLGINDLLYIVCVKWGESGTIIASTHMYDYEAILKIKDKSIRKVEYPTILLTPTKFKIVTEEEIKSLQAPLSQVFKNSKLNEFLCK